MLLTAYSFWIDTLMSADHNMQTSEETDEIFLVPYQVTNFLVQEQQNSELAARASTEQATDPFHDSPLARVWYRDHPEDFENDTRSSDEVGAITAWSVLLPRC